MRLLYRGGKVFDGTHLRPDGALLLVDGALEWIGPEIEAPPAEKFVELGGDILSPGFVDLQVNGGGGLMLNDAPDVQTLRTMAEAHRRLGATTILPTLITDTRETTAAAIAAVTEAIAEVIPGISGLHLEGPHLSLARKGAHDEKLIRPMEPSDLDQLCKAARTLPALMVTVAPESVTPDQVSALAKAGALVSLGHSNADFDTCMTCIEAGARGVTHLFNAMSQLGSREPGLVGAALSSDRVSAGLIADGVHVHPAAIGAAWRAKRGERQIYLVSDAMAPAGTDIASFRLNGREITRRDGRLTLADGTLAGADLDLGRAVRVLVEDCGIALEDALAAATSIPGDLAGLPQAGRLHFGRRPDLIRLSPGFKATPV